MVSFSIQFSFKRNYTRNKAYKEDSLWFHCISEYFHIRMCFVCDMFPFTILLYCFKTKANVTFCPKPVKMKMRWKCYLCCSLFRNCSWNKIEVGWWLLRARATWRCYKLWKKNSRKTASALFKNFVRERNLKTLFEKKI